MTSYTTSAEYEPRPFDATWTEVSTILYCLRYTAFWWIWSDKFPRLIIKSKALDICYACCISCNYYKSLKKESYEKPYDFIDDYDDAVHGYGNDPNLITDVELEVHNKQYTKSKRHIL